MNPSNPTSSINSSKLNLFNRSFILQLGIITACLALLYAPVVKGLIIDWINLPDFSHGFLIPIISIFFIYEKRNQLLTLNPSGQWIGLGLTIFGIMLLFLGNLAAEYFTERFSLIVVMGGIIFFLLGKEFFKALFFPLIFLIFMIPIPSLLMDRITFPMQLLASTVAANSLYLIGIPVLKEGNIIHLANNSLEVAEACSGIRSLISLLALSVVFAHFTQKNLWKRMLLVICALPIAVIANAARVSGTGALSYYYGEEVAQGFFHGFSGWILFVMAFVCLFIVGSLLSRIKSR